MASSLDIVVRGVCGLSKIAMEHLVRIICMVLGWVIAFKLDQECDRLSHSQVVCNHFFIGFCVGSSWYYERNFVW